MSLVFRDKISCHWMRGSPQRGEEWGQTQACWLTLTKEVEKGCGGFQKNSAHFIKVRELEWSNFEKYQISHSLIRQMGILVIYSFYGNLMKKYEIDHRRSIMGHLYVHGTRCSYWKGDKKRLWFLFGYILITTALRCWQLLKDEKTGYF